MAVSDHACTDATLLEKSIRLVETDTVGIKAVANIPLNAGTIIHKMDGTGLKTPSMHTIQLDDQFHIMPMHGAEFISHGCFSSANTRIVLSSNWRSAVFVVLRDLAEGEDLRFDYNTTEWEISCKFICQCPHCATQYRPRYVSGYKNLTLEERMQTSSHASPFIKSKARSELTAHLKMLKSIEDEYFN